MSGLPSQPGNAETTGSDGCRPVIIIVGWDGAVPELLEKFAAKVSIPTVAKAMKDGVFARLRSTIPPVTACAWSSFLSGKNPGKTGLFDFVTPRAGGYQFDYTNGGYRRDRQTDVLRLLNQAGLRVGCVNVPMTFPPYAVDGFMISGLDAPDEKSGIALPAEVFDRAQAKVGPYRIDNRHLGSMKTDDDRRSVLEEFKSIETRRTDITLAMMEECPVDVLIIIYNATDQVQHHFWHLMDENHPAHQRGSREVELFRNAIEEIYVHCDKELARLLRAFPQADWMLVSDHGAGPTCGPQVRLNNALAHAGLLSWANKKGSLVSSIMSKVDGILRRTLSAKQKALLARLFPSGRSRLESMSLAEIDYDRTVAFAYEGFTLSPCVWINRQDKFPRGTVASGAEYEDACRRVEAALTSLRDPQTGEQVIPRVYRSSEVYSGAFMQEAPDLILDWWNGRTFTITRSHPSHQAESPVLPPVTQAVPGRDITGIHRRDGILVANGPHLRQPQAGTLSVADLHDIAPTVLSLIGRPIPPDMDGRALHDIIAGTVTTHPAGGGAGSPPKGGDGPAVESREYSDEEKALIEQRLSSLGYIE